MSGTLALGLAGLALKWVAADGIDGAAEEKLTNDLADLNYIVLGVLSEELHSKEKRVRELYEDLNAVMEHRWAALKELYAGLPPLGPA